MDFWKQGFFKFYSVDQRAMIVADFCIWLRENGTIEIPFAYGYTAEYQGGQDVSVPGLTRWYDHKIADVFYISQLESGFVGKTGTPSC